jgi:hypothetical protein
LSAIHTVLSEYMSRAGEPLEVDDEAGRTVIEVDGSESAWYVIGEALDDVGVASVRAVLAPRVDEPHRNAVITLLNRINLDLPMGAWSLDPADGELQFRVGADFKHQEPRPELVEPLVALCVLAPERYWPAIAAVAAGGDPAAAFSGG